MVMVLGYDSKVAGFNPDCGGRNSTEAECQRFVYCVMSVDIKEHQAVKISRALYYGMHDNRITVFARQTPHIVLPYN